MTEPVCQRVFRVHGRVQGVGFRWWTRTQALRLGVSGTVRNQPDGTVEVRARATGAAMDSLRRLLRQGPPGSRVDRVEEHPTSGLPADSFQILR
jgi:acylphosphatase